MKSTSKPFGFVIRHGWSFHAGSLAQLARICRQLSPHVLCDDLGYWSDEPSIPERAREISWIAVGHSYGFATLLEERSGAWHAVIGISPFLAFPHAGLAEMQSAMEREPRATVRAFRRRCASRRPQPLPPDNSVGHRRMLAALERLATLHLDPPKQASLYLHGAHDEILAPLPGALLHPEAGHLLGIDEAPWCGLAIASFLENLF
jgi:hypothetical protein